jgi:hypothetical protein
MPALTSAAVSTDASERKIQELLYEFYRRYFTGAPVTVGANSRTFPLLPKNTETETAWLFGADQLLGHPPAWVHTVISDWRPEESEISPTQKLVTGSLVLAIYVRAATPAKGFQSADQTCRSIADGLRQIFESEQLLLAEKDLHHMKVKRGPIPVTYPGAQSRMLMVTGQAMYRVDY